MKTKNLFARDNNLTILDKKLNENGYLVVKCIFARTGIQERYGAEINEDFEATKLYKEYRSPDEVFKPEVIEAFKNIVITNDHPNELLNSKNTKFYAIGFVSSPVRVVDDSYLECEITIYDDSTIEDIQAGKMELSAGYLYNLEVVENPNYDYIQTDIKPNHIAIVKAGRCGSKCSLAIDNKPNLNEGKCMKKVVFKIMLPDGTEKIVSEVEVENEELAKNLQGVADSLFEATKTAKATDEDEIKAKDDEIEALKTELKTKDETIDKLQAEKDIIKPKGVATDSKVVLAMATDLASVMMVAKDSGIECVGKDSLSIKKEVIARYQPDLDLNGKSDEYIGYAFDNVASQLKQADSSYLKGLDLKPTPALDEAKKEVVEAKNKFEEKFGGNQ